MIPVRKQIYASVNREQEKLMTVSEVATFLKISHNTVRSLTDRGELDCYRVGGRNERRFSIESIQAYLERNGSNGYQFTRRKFTNASKAREPVPAYSSTAILNQGLHVHDWYLMPESYSEPLIVEAIERFGINPGETILDPFSGTGTTVLTAILKGINGIGLEVNPFLAFVSRVKLDWDVDSNLFKSSLVALLNETRPLLRSMSVNQDLFDQNNSDTRVNQIRSRIRAILAETSEPDMPRLYKWMTKIVVQKILILRYIIGQRIPKRLQPYFLLALASILRPASNMKLTPHAFGSNSRKEDAPVFDLFAQKIHKMYSDLEYVNSLDYQHGKGYIGECDVRSAESLQHPFWPASLVITSPPYLNNLDYTMQTRMELFFLKFAENMIDLRNLRKAMLICDAKAMYKDIKDSEEVAKIGSIQNIADSLREAHKGKNWGWDYAFMTTQYFGGMLRTLRTLKPLLKRHAPFVLIVGESSHSGIKVPVPDILAELGELAGYTFEEINVIRRRRSSSHSHELCESEVILRKK